MVEYNATEAMEKAQQQAFEAEGARKLLCFSPTIGYHYTHINEEPENE